MITSTEAAIWRSSSKQVFLKILQFSQESNYVGYGTVTLLKSNCSTGVFLWITENFLKWEPQWQKRKTSAKSWPCELNEECRLFEINCSL